MDNQDEKGGRGYCVVDIFFVTEDYFLDQQTN